LGTAGRVSKFQIDGHNSTCGDVKVTFGQLILTLMPPAVALIWPGVALKRESVTFSRASVTLWRASVALTWASVTPRDRSVALPRTSVTCWGASVVLLRQVLDLG
jgi:hypothetical protein